MTTENVTRVKHQQIYEKIFERILAGEYAPGEKLPTEHQLAEIFDASRPTVGKALQELDKKGLINRRPGAGTFVRQPSANRGQKLGLLVPRLSVEPGDFEQFVSLYSTVVSQISQSANASEHVLLMNDLPAGEEDEIIDHAWRICQQLIDLQVKGVFFLPLELGPDRMDVNADIAQSLDKAGITVTLMDRDIYPAPQRSKFDIVGINNERSADALVDHLIRIGCRKIDFVGSTLHVSAVQERVQGYKNALQRHGMEVERQRIHTFSVQPFSHEDIDVELAAVQQLMGETDTEALMCVNDRTAALVMRYVLHMGMNVPEDLRIVGFDDEPFSSFLTVPLTTVRQPARAIGKEAVRTMMSRIDEPDLPPRDVLLGTDLVIRQSCGGAKSKSN